MKFLIDFGVALTGLVLLLSTLLTIVAAVAYVIGARPDDAWWTLTFSVPVMVVCGVIAWWRRDVLAVLIGWMIPF
jgi:hypothetical protein